MPKRSKNRAPRRLADVGIQTPNSVIADIVSHNKQHGKKSVVLKMRDVTYKPLLDFETGHDCSGSRRSTRVCRRWSRANLVFVNGDGCRHHRRKSLIGRGAYGHVYRSCCRKVCKYTTKYVAFTKKYSKSDFYREVMYQQIAAKAGLAPKIMESYVTDSRGVIVMENLTGPALFEVHNNNLDIEDPIEMRKSAHTIARQIGRLLGHLHKLGIWHGDAHDHNILQDSKGQWKLIDFGMAGEFRGKVREDLAAIQEDHNTTLVYRKSRVPSYDSNQWAYTRHYYKQLDEYLIKNMRAYEKKPYVLE